MTVAPETDTTMAEAPLKASKEVKDATAVSEDSTDATAATEKHTFGPSVHISKHPVLLHKISILRSANTPSGQFRSVLREITYHLGYEATAGLTTRPIPVSVSAGKESPNDHLDCTGDKLIERVAVVPILRSGLGMSDSMLELLPKASVYHIGMYRIPGSAPVQYFNRLPRKCASDAAIVLDPVIASAQTSLAAIAMLKKWGVPKIHLVSVLGSSEGLATIEEQHPDVQITVGTVDSILTKDGIVLPGLGDAGDRLFGCVDPDDHDESLLHPSKRSRTA
uniref:uracil phosphoribosyltransferase n=1 Tax=Craspedostauros australis TaxID=1486917 RepID=A0A7R9WS49_9STRA|mmetsp:Transcript_18192/g.50496  ORF Transcript_18192/g.50496 Transcript_18192/m.50496 type:complete len:279 (+) Transcript_18192:324-1160(+)